MRPAYEATRTARPPADKPVWVRVGRHESFRLSAADAAGLAAEMVAAAGLAAAVAAPAGGDLRSLATGYEVAADRLTAAVRAAFPGGTRVVDGVTGQAGAVAAGLKAADPRQVVVKWDGGGFGPADAAGLTKHGGDQ